MSNVEDPAIKRKYKELKKRIRDIEDDNDTLNVRLTKAKKHINRLRLERSVLLERLERSTDYIDDGSDSNSDISDAGGGHSLLADIKSRHEPKSASTLNASHDHGPRQKGADSKPARKKKDPNAPKGPGNVFFLYSRMERDKIKDEYPGENQGDLTRILGQKWKNLTKDEKQKYYDIYKKEQEEYEEAMKSYTASGSVAGTPGLETASQTEDHMSMGEDDEEEDMLNEDDDVSMAPPLAETSSQPASQIAPSTSPVPELLPPSISLNAEPPVPSTEQPGQPANNETSQ